MKSLNKVLLIGYTASDPEIRVLKNGVKVANFSFATNKKDDKNNQITDFHKIVAWQGLAEVIEKYVKKGKGLFLEGSIQNSTWDDKDGNKRYSTEIVATDLNMLTYDDKSEKTKI
jgi:single-strand DNA-binding protein